MIGHRHARLLSHLTLLIRKLVRAISWSRRAIGSASGRAHVKMWVVIWRICHIVSIVGGHWRRVWSRCTAWHGRRSRWQTWTICIAQRRRRGAKAWTLESGWIHERRTILRHWRHRPRRHAIAMSRLVTLALQTGGRPMPWQVSHLRRGSHRVRSAVSRIAFCIGLHHVHRWLACMQRR